MVDNEIRKDIIEVSENAIIFENPAFDHSIIGFDALSDAVVYDYNLMVDELANEYYYDEGYKELFKDSDISDEDFAMQCVMDAVDWIDYNTLRALPYFQSNDGVKPIIVSNLGLDSIIANSDRIPKPINNEGAKENERPKEN